MADNKKYYYLKLNENFFEREEIKIIEAQPNGYEYSNILLKMYLKSLKRDGKLMVTNLIPYSVETLSKVLGHNVDTVRNAIKVFEEFKLVEILDNGAIYLLDIQNFIGKSSTEADRKRIQRARIEEEKKLLKEQKSNEVELLIEDKKEDKSPDKCPKSNKEVSKIAVSNEEKGQMSDKCSRETEIETEIEIQQQIVNIVKCEVAEAKTILKTVRKYHKNKDVVAVVLDKLNIISKGNFNNRIGALVSAIKEDWTRSSSNNTKTSGFCNFEGRDYTNGYGGLTYEDLEEQLVYGMDEEE
ncbi:phage replisome organizer N-terminal domain-containing protein [Clostridium paraputrificum]|uniref:phage replisome organizer N-terminal domain-containing protein n=1 Tax=Clostridium paraputrificum TaxID=29363 RepID=UPI0018992ADD|nr:phage replisome organizer N-terminal domain-containing protein [Clostridium paraputrificum]MDB2125250.1 phage replisome organizer N-terminal domain-containing protein [Clostridium paraputrificum]